MRTRHPGPVDKVLGIGLGIGLVRDRRFAGHPARGIGGRPFAVHPEGLVPDATIVVAATEIVIGRRVYLRPGASFDGCQTQVDQQPDHVAENRSGRRGVFRPAPAVPFGQFGQQRRHLAQRHPMVVEARLGELSPARPVTAPPPPRAMRSISTSVA